MIDELHAEHFKIVLHVVIEGAAHDRHGRRSVHGADKAVPSGRHGRSTSGRHRPRMWPATGRITSLSTISASTAGGLTRATVSMPPRAWRASACTGRARSCSRPNERPVRAAPQRLRPACSVTERSSGRATCIRPGRRSRRTCRSRSTRASRAYRSGGPTSAASCRPRNTPASCTCAGSSSAPSARCSARTDAPGTCGCRGAGTPVSSAQSEVRRLHRRRRGTSGERTAQCGRRADRARSISSCATACCPYIYTAVRECCDDRPAR